MKYLLIIAFSLLFNDISLAQQKQRSIKKYFFVVGWESYPDPRKERITSQPVVSNIFAIRCKANSKPEPTGIQNDFNDFYTAYFGKQRGFGGLTRLIAFGEYDSWEEAEKERRKRIADYNKDWHPILVEEFSSSCD